MEYNHRLLLKGNEAAVYGALFAGCDCYFGYPITPASEIAQTAAEDFPRLGRVFLQKREAFPNARIRQQCRRMRHARSSPSC